MNDTQKKEAEIKKELDTLEDERDTIAPEEEEGVDKPLKGSLEDENDK